MKRNKQNIKRKRDRRNDLNEFDPLEQKRRRAKKFNRNKRKNRGDFSNQYDYESYLDNIDYYDRPNTIETFQ